ncbi:hypothetical protein EDP2_3915 [Enterobacter cloacae S611]|uniref:Uncharacterized protein n=1 Tax=Enterobacter cloacae S611 TaxID=1399146 RepID=A0ABN0QCU1_ENTCL|nr:hypothetical protein EDP2_3915 [Enterobacter cloacae S611]
MFLINLVCKRTGSNFSPSIYFTDCFACCVTCNLTAIHIFKYFNILNLVLGSRD